MQREADTVVGAKISRDDATQGCVRNAKANIALGCVNKPVKICAAMCNTYRASIGVGGVHGKSLVFCDGARAPMAPAAAAFINKAW